LKGAAGNPPRLFLWNILGFPERMSSFKLIALSFVACLALAVVAAGCGSGGDSTTSDGSSAALTKAEFIKQGDAICKETDKIQNKDIRLYLVKNPGSSGKKEDVEKVIKVGLGQIKVEAEEVDALGAPEGDEEKVEAIVRGIEDGLKKAEEDPVSTNKSGAANPFAAVDKLTTDYGFKVCNFVY
jgi:hypothetical protein